MARAGARGAVFALALLPATSACESVPATSGATAWLRVVGAAAQFTPGPLPAASAGPAVTGVLSLQNEIQPGQTDYPLGATLAAGATAAALALDGDQGFWLVRAGAPDVTTRDQPTVSVLLHFAATLPLGERALWVQARDADGNAGPPRPQTLRVLPSAGAVPDGALVVSLRWDRPADLDLHVEQPDGLEIWSGRKLGYAPPPGQPPDPAEEARAGRLDHDSDAACVIDGLQAEDVVYPAPGPPPAGRYRVRVDAASLCQQSSARWTVELRRGGVPSGQASGESTDAATRGPHGEGAGVLALEFDVP